MLTELQYRWALKRVEWLADQIDGNMPEDNELRLEYEILSEAVADYSDAHFDLGEPSLLELIKLRMFERGALRLDYASSWEMATPMRFCGSYTTSRSLP